MATVDRSNELSVPPPAGGMKWWWRTGGVEGDGELVEVLLRGKAPWGFTLRGGTEHREPLLITKVEDGSAAAAVRLQAGDEMVCVNGILLGGSRQEAISLVKSSHKTLHLVVRRAKMVDVVSPRTMPSESEVHVARSFLTKILRSSMRKNDPVSRPHSWHSSKLTEEEPEPAKREASPAAVWQPKHEASNSRPEESSIPEDQDTQQQLTNQFTLANNMERLERPSQLYPPARLSPTKYLSGTEPTCGPGGKRDSGLSCLSSGASPPGRDCSMSGVKGTSAENIFFKGLQSDRQSERPRYLQQTPGNGSWEASRVEEHPAARVSVAGRPSMGPVWQVPEKKKSQSPPPPPPPLRSDSFAATKVFPYSEGPIGSVKGKGRSFEKLTESNNQNCLRPQTGLSASEARQSFPHLPTKDFLHPTLAADHNHNQMHPNKLFSLSSNDVRQSHHIHVPAHQRQYSDESPHYLQTRSAPPTKIQSVGSYYRSLQDLPTNTFGHKQVRHSTASMASFAANPNLENGGHKRYYGIAGKHLVQNAELQARQCKAEGHRGEPEKFHWVNSNEPAYQSSLKMNQKAKYSLPPFQTSYSESKERSGHSQLGNGLHYDHHALEHSVPNRSPEDASTKGKGDSNDSAKQFSTHHSNDHKVSHPRHQDPWVPQEDHRITALKTPLLHSLAQESKTLTERQLPGVAQEASNATGTGSAKTNRRSDRYATTLRNEIQQKRAQLQKSRSAATLTCDVDDEDAEEWRSSKASTSSGVSSYKDHLKEMQARVLQATSFQRRDLEPFGPEPAAVRTSNGRVRGRKRFPLAKRTHSFSEPDKIDKVGVEGDAQTGSFGERRKFFETKPAFSRPVLKSSQGSNLNADPGEAGKPKERTPTAEVKEKLPSTDPNRLSPGNKQVLLEQQRLGTFAEYQATWNKQKKSSEAKTQGRYHSAENILDADAEEKAACVHERSRSSPSADFYTQSIPSPWRDQPSQQSSHATSGKCESWQQQQQQQQQFDHSPESAPELVPRIEVPVPGLADHRTKPDATSPSHATQSSGPCSLSPVAGSLHPSQPSQTKGLIPPPRSHLETTSSSSSSSSQEFLSGTQADPAALQPLSTETLQDATPGSSSPTWGHAPHLSCMASADAEVGGTGNGGEEKERPQPPSSPSPVPSQAAALQLPAERARSPSPQFAPLRLTDKPPAVFVQDGSPLRSENDLKPPAEMDANSPVRKVPVRIVQAGSSLEREGRAYLPQSSDSSDSSATVSTVSEPPSHAFSLSAAERPAPSLFCTYSRQADQDHKPVPESASAGALHSKEDAKREELARDIMGKDKSLVDILDQSGRMTTMDLMEGLFPTEEQLLEGALQRRRASSSSRLLTASPRSMDRREDEDLSVSAAVSLVPSSSYYNTSAPKAELLIKMKDMQDQLEEQESEDELDVDLASKKQELISSLAGKLEVLREARHSLQEDVEDNEALGREVEATVQRLCQPNQLDKFRMFVGDLDKVVSLLLSLSGRLARVENALNSLEEEAPPEEKRTLTEKRKLLMRQHEDAKELKENLDRRERLVSGIMEAHLDAESLDDYRHFVKMKSALIIEQRKLEDKIKLGEEQLKCLVDSLPLEQRPRL